MFLNIFGLKVSRWVDKELLGGNMIFFNVSKILVYVLIEFYLFLVLIVEIVSGVWLI